MNKKLLLRDSLLVLPVLLLGVLWVVLGVILQVDLTPDADYSTSMLLNLILPLLLIGLLQMAYGVVLIVDIARSKSLSTGKKVLYGALIWFAVQWLYMFVYIARVIWLLGRKRAMPENMIGKGDISNDD